MAPQVPSESVLGAASVASRAGSFLEGVPSTAEPAELIELAREAFRNRDWLAAREGFSAARDQRALSGADLYALGDCAWWLALVDEYLAVTEEAYHALLGEGDERLAANAALGMAYSLSLRGDDARASGWGSRGMRLLQSLPECAEHGYAVYMEVESAISGARYEDAARHAATIREMGHRFADANLFALALVGEGRSLVGAGRVPEGMKLLDEAMLAAVSGGLNPSWAGNVYCHLMLVCYELQDLKRAAEWTEATARWCESMPGAGPFMGICRVHRAQVLHARGAWEQAESEAARVSRDLAHFHVSIVGQAHYELGEIRRQRGDLRGAEESFKEAHQRGCDVQPGLALLRLAQGRTREAFASIEATWQLADGHALARARLAPALVEIAIAAADLDAARRASEELVAAAARYGSSGLQAAALHASGAVLAAEGQLVAAVTDLRSALQLWQSLGVPYEAARVRELLGQAFEHIGDSDAAAFEREAAAATFKALRNNGARTQRAPGAPPSGLTPRELEVLLLAARGMSNAEIAESLVLSVRTVERHLATVYQKLGLGGRNARAAAITHAHELGLVPPTT